MDDSRQPTDAVTDAKPGIDSEVLIPGFGLWSHGRPYRVPPKPDRLLAASCGRCLTGPSTSWTLLSRYVAYGPRRVQPEHIDRIRVYATGRMALEGTGIVVRVRRDRTSGRSRVSIVFPRSE